MKALFIIAAAILATGCATSQNSYYNAVKAREDRLAAEENRVDSHIATMGATGGEMAKGMSIMYFATKRSNANNTAQIPAPRNEALQWASILVPSLTQLYGINRNTAVSLANINADVDKYETTMGTLGAISSQGMTEAGKVVFPPVYTVPMGSAPVAATPAAPAVGAVEAE